MHNDTMKKTMSDVPSLYQKHCKPCGGDMLPLTADQYSPFLKVVLGWNVIEEKAIEKEFKWKNFKDALAFVNKIGEIAESEGHHPDIFLHGYNKVKVTLSTHAIHGLSDNDFILAAKIDRITNLK